MTRGSDGLTLTVPAKSLSVPTTIRLVPVASLSPGPRGATPIMSVIIEPEGLLVPGATIISLALSIERQAQLLGVESPVSIVAEVAKALKKAAANEIKKCADGGQGPLKTQTAVLSVARAVALLGGDDILAELLAQLESDSLSKPYLLTYEMATEEMLNTAPRPPGAVSGRVFINDLPVPVPRSGAAAAAALGPMNSSNSPAISASSHSSSPAR